MKILVWLGAFSDHWSGTRAHPGDAWVAATILQTKGDSIKAQRDDNPDHCAWIKAEHWKEFVESDD